MTNIASNEWPFDQPKNCATFTMKQIMNGSESILRVTHDADDHGWQFIGSSDASMKDAMLVCLHEIVNIDPSVLEVANLPVGWCAIRTHKGGEWNRIEQGPYDEDEK